MNSVPRYTFGPRLRVQRERLGITLEQIADSTKIGISVLAALERNDVSQWPKGIFRRAFFKAYAAAIRLPFEPAWAEFQQLFPEDGSPGRERTPDDDDPLRLTLARGARYRMLPGARQSLTAAIDTACVLVLAGVVTLLGGAFWTATGVIALLWFAGGTALLGGTLGARLATARLGSGDAQSAPLGTALEEGLPLGGETSAPRATAPPVDAPELPLGGLAADETSPLSAGPARVTPRLLGGDDAEQRLSLDRPARAARPIGLSPRRQGAGTVRRGRDQARPS